MMTQDVAQWMFEELRRSKYLFQHIIAYDIASKFGAEFISLNEDGSLAIDEQVLNDFAKITGEMVIWDSDERAWRLRDEYYPKLREGLAPVPSSIVRRVPVAEQIKQHSPDIAKALEIVQADLDGWWDADDGMAEEVVMSRSYAQLLMVLHSREPQIVELLCLFVARRALTIWEDYGLNSRVRENYEMLRAYLEHATTPDSWQSITRAFPTPFGDCRYSDTQSASDAVAHAARYCKDHLLLQAVYCVSSADCAYDHVRTEDQFRQWLLEIAVPAAIDRRFLTEAEQESMRSAW